MITKAVASAGTAFAAPFTTVPGSIVNT